MNLHGKCSKIRAVVLDVDGVLTDGRIGYGGETENEIKFFNVRDGHGIVLAAVRGFWSESFPGASRRRTVSARRN